MGITEPGREDAGEPADPWQAALGFLAYLQAELVEELMDRL
jgi:hypothetical protein